MASAAASYSVHYGVDLADELICLYGCMADTVPFVSVLVVYHLPFYPCLSA
jgi:hypothetical protein